MSDVTVKDNELSEMEALNAELFNDVFTPETAKRQQTLSVSRERQAWYKAHTMDYGKDGKFTVVREIFPADVPDGFSTAYLIQVALVSPESGKIAYRPSGLYLVGMRENGAMVILTNSGKRLSSWVVAKRELSFNIVEKCRRLSHLFGVSHRDIYAATIRDAQTTRTPASN